MNISGYLHALATFKRRKIQSLLKLELVGGLVGFVSLFLGVEVLVSWLADWSMGR